jgi:Meckel syndrome type 1 protein
MTTPLPPQPPHDDDALPGETELKALYDRLPQHEPGPALDAAVLRAAAQAVERPASRRRARWPVALGTAATLVLAAGLVWQMRKLPAEAPAASSAPASSASADARAGADREAAENADAAVQATRRAAAQAMQAKSARQSAPAAKAMSTRPVIAPPAATGYVAPTASTATGIEPPKLTASRVRTSNVPAAKNANLAPAPLINDSATPATPMAPSPVLDQAATGERADSALSAAAPPAPPAPPPAPMIQSAPMPESAPMPSAVPIGAPTEAAALMATPLSESSSTAPRPSAVEPTEQATPEMTAELQAIRSLYDQGDGTAARGRLEAFHRQHPHFVLPDDLRQRLDGTP